MLTQLLAAHGLDAAPEARFHTQRYRQSLSICAQSDSFTGQFQTRYHSPSRSSTRFNKDLSYQFPQVELAVHDNSSEKPPMNMRAQPAWLSSHATATKTAHSAALQHSPADSTGAPPAAPGNKGRPVNRRRVPGLPFLQLPSTCHHTSYALMPRVSSVLIRRVLFMLCGTKAHEVGPCTAFQSALLSAQPHSSPGVARPKQAHSTYS